MEIPEGAIAEREAQRTATMGFPKSRKRTSSRRLISDDKDAKIGAYLKECEEKGIAQGSTECQAGLSKILNSNREIETRVVCVIGVKHVTGHVMKPKGHEKEPWWLHILNTKYTADTLRNFNLFELEQLIRDLSASAGVHCTAIPARKHERVAMLREMIELAVKKNRDVGKCPHYYHFAHTWVPVEWCINCPRDCLLDHCIDEKEVK